MPDNTNNNFNPGRRASDLTPSGLPPTIFDVWHLLVIMKDDLEEVKRQQKDHASAFLKNDLGGPDFDGHRKHHGKMVKSEEVLASYKVGATKNLVYAIISFIGGLIVTGFWSRIMEHVK